MRKILLASLLIASLNTQADEQLYTQRFSTCLDQAGGVTYSMLDCISEELTTQDARLNGAYQKLQKSLSAERKQALLTAQRLWIKYRDANCDFYNDPEGGSYQRVMANECMLRETAERAKELETLSEP
ncbi:lysozyme inhibitor LprI family protein [Lamprobacter modestohalophilus]|uniref:lysozyme inhibitor LprI family protein n=1 Tax=Lamprobacter modestohalophilus TaxID=1064514 RepID=UPI002ADEB56B|nr:lysozyme inhibitor LprI family protein [Lamprobacter modestohalophilus]MEA1051885.1 lysozyme inhibitor LprI family protein [Lamprobacter modestohalophilus]